MNEKMWYINAEPTENGSYGNPQDRGREGMLALPDILLSDYIGTMGFAKLTVEDGVVTAVAVNQEAMDAYKTDHPDTPVDPQPTQEDRIEAQVMYTALMTDTLLEEEE